MLTLTRRYLIEADDLVDELLGQLKSCSWSNLRMEYHLNRLTATRKSSHQEQSADQEEVRLSASWQEEDEEMILTVTVTSEPPSAEEQKLKAAAAQLLNSMFAKEPYRVVVDPSNN